MTLFSTPSNCILKTLSEVPGKGIPVNDSCCKKCLSFIKREVLDSSINTLKWEETTKNVHFMKISNHLYGEWQNLSPLKALQAFSRKKLRYASAMQHATFDLSSTLFSLANKGTGITGWKIVVWSLDS